MSDLDFEKSRRNTLRQKIRMSLTMLENREKSGPPLSVDDYLVSVGRGEYKEILLLCESLTSENERLRGLLKYIQDEEDPYGDFTIPSYIWRKIDKALSNEPEKCQ